MKNSTRRAPGRSQGSRLRRIGSAAAVIFVLALLALGTSACGGGGSTSSNPPAASGGQSGSRYQEALKYSECMRSHGIANFPDPNSNGDINLSSNVKNGQVQGNGVNQDSPQFKSADKTCSKLLPNGGAPSAAQNQQHLAEALQFSQCMRTHGIAKWPDPTVKNGAPQGFNLDGTGIDPQSPQFQSAMSTCQRLTHFTL
jgi:hypothetical protein